jgi:hypothetical protein
MQSELFSVLSKPTCREIYERYRWAVSDAQEGDFQVGLGIEDWKRERWLVTRERDLNMWRAWQQRPGDDEVANPITWDLTLLTEYERVHLQAFRRKFGEDNPRPRGALLQPDPEYAARARAERAKHAARAAARAPRKRSEPRTLEDKRLIAVNGVIQFRTQRHDALEAALGTHVPKKEMRYAYDERDASKWAWLENHKRLKQELLNELANPETKQVYIEYRPGLRILLQQMRTSSQLISATKDDHTRVEEVRKGYVWRYQLTELLNERARNLQLAKSRAGEPALLAAPFEPDYKELRLFERGLDQSALYVLRRQLDGEVARAEARRATNEDTSGSDSDDPAPDYGHGFELYTVLNKCIICNKIDEWATVVFGPWQEIKHISLENCGNHEHERGKETFRHRKNFGRPRAGTGGQPGDSSSEKGITEESKGNPAGTERTENANRKASEAEGTRASGTTGGNDDDGRTDFLEAANMDGYDRAIR